MNVTLNKQYLSTKNMSSDITNNIRKYRLCIDHEKGVVNVLVDWQLVKFDIEDIDIFLQSNKWYLSGGRKNHRYLLAYIDKKIQYFHRIVAERKFGVIPKSKHVDHKDGRTFDNTRNNLRLVSRRSNMCNMKVGKSGYRHVNVTPEDRYFVSFRWNRRNFRFGTYDTAIEAARVADAIKFHIFADQYEDDTYNFNERIRLSDVVLKPEVLTKVNALFAKVRHIGDAKELL